MIRPPATSVPTLSALALCLALAAPVIAHAATADRYGPSPEGAAVASLVAPTAAPASQATADAAPMTGPPAPPRLRGLLTWPGKTDAPAALVAALPGREAPPTYRSEVAAARQTHRHGWDRGPWARSAGEGRTGRSVREARLDERSRPADAAATQMAARQTIAPVEAAAVTNAPARSLPTSIYDSPGPQAGARVVAMAARPTPAPASGPAPRQVATASPARPRLPYGEGVRFYSVHRQFGLTPDRDPIPPQFFAVTPDLSQSDPSQSDPSQPDGPLANRRVLTGSGGSAIAQRSAAEAQNAGGSTQP